MLSKILHSVGYEVKQHFYVNDLGFQIGLTALGYQKLMNTTPANMKEDHWMGMIYAIMNTFHELQQIGIDLAKFHALKSINGDVTTLIAEEEEKEQEPVNQKSKKPTKKKSVKDTVCGQY